MNFKDLELNHSYRSLGNDNIADVVNRVLSITKKYKRSVGFFSSSCLDFIKTGIDNVVNNDGLIQLIVSPKLSSDDIEAIKIGYETREKIIKNSFMNDFSDVINKLENENLIILSKLIAAEILDIQIADTKTVGIYHDKVAIFEDNDGNKLVFVGSNNETGFAYGYNDEKIRVYKSWITPDDVKEEEESFDKIWEGTDEILTTLSFRKAMEDKIIEVLTERGLPLPPKKRFSPRPYQVEAIDAWVKNDYKGFFIMATGTGKTLTALFCAEKLMKKEPLMIVIAVPYKHLVQQWYEDVIKIFDTNVYDVFRVSGEFANWNSRIKTALFNQKFSKNKKGIIILSTLKSFYSDKFDDAIRINNYKKLLIVDEAHNFINQIYDKKHNIDGYEYKIGLSATPVFGNDKQKTDDLCNFFGGVVYELPIEKAIGKFLVNYNYYPIYVDATQEDEDRFNAAKRRMASCIDKNTGAIIDKEGFNIAYREKLRSIAMAENKIENVGEFIDYIKARDHFIVYCSDGKIDDKKFLHSVVDLLNERGLRPSQFTCEESMDERMRLIDSFNNGTISCLPAIKCLDEGVNIPSIETALILSSNDNYREFVQRRGRILRLYEGKKVANIYDVIVLPTKKCKDIAEIEFRRFYEYSRISLNHNQMLNDFNNYLDYYGLTLDDIKFNDDVNGMENELDD